MLVGPFEDYDYAERFETVMSGLRRAGRRNPSAKKAYLCLLHLIKSVYQGEAALEIRDVPKPDRWLLYDCGYEVWVQAATRERVVFLDAIRASDPLGDLI